MKKSNLKQKTALAFLKAAAMFSLQNPDTAIEKTIIHMKIIKTIK